jgi:drug/metabolite transporter (DMT)-like permease
MLVLFNIIPLTIYFLLLARWIERLGTTDWGRLFAIAAAVFGTFLTTFAITINNHLIAAACAMLAVDAALRIGFDGQRRARDFILAGLFGSLMVFNEFPAASLWALLALLLLWLAPRQTLIAFLPAAILVAIAAFGANWIAFGSFEPAYAHRDSHDTWYNYTYEVRGRTIESYWNNPVGFDRGEPSRGLYMLNVLVGHHGVFSLTPVWLLSFLGLGLWLWRPHDPRLRWMSAIILLSSLVCLAFYISLPPILRNYGGRTSGLRWMFWLAPLWLLAMLPALDTLAQRRWTRGLALVLLLLSALSAAYPIWNPWTDPWLMDAVRWWGRGA